MIEHETVKTPITLDDLLKWVNGHIDGQPDPSLEARMQADIQSKDSRIAELIDAAKDIQDLFGGTEIMSRRGRAAELESLQELRADMIRRSEILDQRDSSSSREFADRTGRRPPLGDHPKGRAS